MADKTYGEQHCRILLKTRAIMHACSLIGLNVHEKETIIALKVLALTCEMDQDELAGLLTSDPKGITLGQHIDFFLADVKVGK